MDLRCMQQGIYHQGAGEEEDGMKGYLSESERGSERVDWVPISETGLSSGLNTPPRVFFF